MTWEQGLIIAAMAVAVAAAIIGYLVLHEPGDLTHRNGQRPFRTVGYQPRHTPAAALILPCRAARIPVAATLAAAPWESDTTIDPALIPALRAMLDGFPVWTVERVTVGARP